MKALLALRLRMQLSRITRPWGATCVPAGTDASRCTGFCWQKVMRGVLFPRCMLVSAERVASAAPCLDLQGRQPILSSSHGEEKAGAFIKKEGAAVPC